MVKSITNMSFGSAIGAMDKVSKEKLYDPGLYSQAMAEIRRDKREDQQQRQPRYRYREPMSFMGFIGRLVLTAGIVLGVPLLARKHVSKIKNIDLTQELAPKTKLVQRMEYYTAKVGDWVDKNMLQKISSKEVKAEAKTEVSKGAEPPAEPKK